MSKMFGARNFLLALVVLIFGVCAEFAYHMNYVCGPDEHIIKSDADAIRWAQSRIFRARYGSHGIPGYIDEKPYVGDFSQPNC